MISKWSIDLRFPFDEWWVMRHFYHVPVGHLNVFFGETAVWVFAHFLCCFILFYFILFAKSSLYTLGVNFLSDAWFLNIFSHYIYCLFILLIVSLSVQKISSLMESHLSISPSVACAFDVMGKKPCQDQCQEDFPLYFLLQVL